MTHESDAENIIYKPKTEWSPSHLKLLKLDGLFTSTSWDSPRKVVKATRAVLMNIPLTSPNEKHNLEYKSSHFVKNRVMTHAS